MKKILLTLMGCLGLLGCHPMRMSFSDLNTMKDSIQTYSFLEASASLDTIPSINAAQTSELVLTPNTTQKKKQVISIKRPGVLKSIKLAKRLYQSVNDSTKLYKRRTTERPQQVNPSARASLWTGIGTYALLILGAGIGAFTILAIFSAVAAVITGIVGLSEIHHYPELYRGKGQAITGICLGGTFIAILALVILIVLAFLSSY